jgi:hypothetical protein
MSIVRSTSRRRRGSATVEFALCALVFFLFAFGIIEMARVVYLWTTLAEATHYAARLAAVANPADGAALTAVRSAAVLRASPGPLVLGGGIDERYFHIDYQNASGVYSDTGPCPQENLARCAENSSSGACVRYVRVRLCLPGGGCDPVPYQPLMGFTELIGRGSVLLPDFQAVAPVGNLGYRAGAAATCP